MFILLKQDMYYSLNSVASPGAGMGAWVSDADKALAFGRDRDAKEFISKFLLPEAYAIEVRRAPA